MRKITAIVILCFLSSLTLSAQETTDNSKDSKSSSTEEYTKFRFGGYGEMVANFKDYGINRFYGGNDGNPKKNRNTISIPRFVVAFDYKFNSRWILGAEIEFESGGTGTISHHTPDSSVYQCTCRTYHRPGGLDQCPP